MVMQNDGDCGLWSHGNKQLPESFAADSGSQVQRASRRYPVGVARYRHSAFRIPQSAFPTHCWFVIAEPITGQRL